MDNDGSENLMILYRVLKVFNTELVSLVSEYTSQFSAWYEENLPGQLNTSFQSSGNRTPRKSRLLLTVDTSSPKPSASKEQSKDNASIATDSFQLMKEQVRLSD